MHAILNSNLYVYVYVYLLSSCCSYQRGEIKTPKVTSQVSKILSKKKDREISLKFQEEELSGI